MVTIYCGHKRFAYVFSDTGVRKVDMMYVARISELDKNSHCCALVDIGDQVLQPPDPFYPSMRRGRVIIATSPDPKHLETFSKQHPASTYFMPTWSWSDLYCSR